ncbi:MAG: winged helix-turn-helix domain-containing protein [Candidatus Thorarchaeota archaeon]
MSENSEIKRLKQEIVELRKTVQTLRDTVTRLTQKIDEPVGQTPQLTTGIYDTSLGLNKILEDASWGRLLNLLTKADTGLTAAELAKRWGKSRSRTSEVLNKLVEEGMLVKYRDGREIRFRPIKE